MTRGGGGGGGDRIVAGLAIAICATSAFIYLSNVPRDGILRPMPDRASAEPRSAAAQPAQGAGARTIGEAPTTPRVQLAVTLWPHGPGKGRRAWSIECPPMTAACRAALGRTRALATEPPGPCPRTRPRDAEALVNGWVAGRYVTAWVDQRDGCGARRWQALRPLLVPPRGPSSTNGGR